MLSSTNRRGGIRQDIQYPIVSNSNYIFSFLAYRENSNGYNGQKIFVGIYSKDDKNKIIKILEERIKTNCPLQYLVGEAFFMNNKYFVSVK